MKFNHIPKVWYLVKSGHPAGEIYDHEVVWARTRERAERAYSQMPSDDGNGNEFIFGGIYERTGNPSELALVYDGHQEVPAPEYK